MKSSPRMPTNLMQSSQSFQQQSICQCCLNNHANFLPI